MIERQEHTSDVMYILETLIWTIMQCSLILPFQATIHSRQCQRMRGEHAKVLSISFGIDLMDQFLVYVEF